MGLFDKPYREISAFLARRQREGIVSEFMPAGKITWPWEKNRNLVLGQDTAVELGNPEDVSTSFLIWVTDPALLKNGRICLVGPDLPQLAGQRVPFGRIIIAGGSDFDADNSYERYREMELLRYDIRLKGYMMRGISQYQREWSRVSLDAVAGGLSFRHLGGALMDKFLQLGYVRAVETIFITSGRKDVMEAKAIADQVLMLINAMNKMTEEMSFECDTCDYNNVCGDVAELRSMRKSLASKGPPVHAYTG